MGIQSPLVTFICLLPAILGCAESNSNLRTSPSWAYVLAYLWTPDLCSVSPKPPGCVDPQEYWQYNFTMHGIWPQYTSQPGYPTYCTKEPYDPTAPMKVGLPTMIKYWPDIKFSVNDKDYGDFWHHEWSKHGTCTGLDQVTYFRSALGLLFQFGSPEILTKATGATIRASSLRDVMGGPKRVALQCDGEGGHTLSGAFTCWSQTGGKPTGTQIDCPQSVIDEDTCTANLLIVKKM
jgi:ribonuclease T2